MCLDKAPRNIEKLYIHTNKYDVVVNKAKFWDLLRTTYPNIELMLNEIEYNSLYTIFCYEVGIVKFCFSIIESKYDITPYCMEFESKTFENMINKILSRY